MDYNEREAQRRQEDRDLNRALIWVGAAVVLEFLLSLINKYYINFRTTPELFTMPAPTMETLATWVFTSMDWKPM